MQKWFFEVLAILLLGGSLIFFYECASYLARKDYVAAVVLLLAGMSVIGVGRELARLALAQKD
ncbi:MAG: hypothetical protein EXR73_03815 [Myxococcales bacterium]|nr:hypothetical protein [Myxococcales bacterium]